MQYQSNPRQEPYMNQQYGNQQQWGQPYNGQNPSPYIYQVPQQQQQQYNSYQQPAYQQPAYQQPAYKQPAYQQPAYQQPAYQQPAYQQQNPYYGQQNAYPIQVNQQEDDQEQIRPAYQSKRTNPQPNVQSGHFKWGVSSNGQGLQANQRMPFIRKVYGLVILQLLLTSFLCILSFTSEGYRNFQLTAYVIMILCVITCIAIEIVVFCYPQHAWKVPRNYILLGVYTICMGYIVSHLCSYCYWRYGDDGAYIVLMAAILTLAAVIGLTIYAFYTKTDFTTKGSALFMFALILLVFFVFALIFQSKVLFLFYALLCCVLFGLYLIYDTQLIIGGRTHQLSIDDYIVGALLIYIDIVYLFMNLIQVLLSCLG